MVLIISATDDVSTNSVIDWLIFYKIGFLRLSNNDKISITKMEINNTSSTVIHFSVRNKFYKTSDFHGVWYRRSWLVIDRNIIPEIIKSVDVLREQVEKQLNSELDVLIQHFVEIIGENSINKFEDIKINKLYALKIAQKCGIKIPNTIITTIKDELVKFTKENSNIITKNFTHGVFVFNKEIGLNSFTRPIEEKEMKDMPDSFFPTLFQEAIDKKFELRIFFIGNEFFSSAIFSQSDDQTKYDFRNYNYEKPNRTPPYELDDKDKKKLMELMSLLKLNSGSIDCIINKKNEMIFLEVNPVGQFAQVSYPCNYYIEKRIAQSLSINA